jgi:hypothetical protein
MPPKVGNYTTEVDQSDLRIARIECLSNVYFLPYYLILSHCQLGIALSQITHQLEPYWLSLVEIHWSTSYINPRWWETYNQCNCWFQKKRSEVENIQGSNALRRNDGLLYAFYLSCTVEFHCSSDPTKPDCNTEIIIAHIPSLCVIYSRFVY